MGPRNEATGWAMPGGAHPMLAALAAAEEAVADLAGFDVTYLNVTEKAAVLKRLGVLSARLGGLRLHAIAASGEVADQVGARDVARWLTANTRVDLTGARRDQRLAEAVDERWRQVGTGLITGAVNPDQARVITTALDELKEAEITRDILTKAETHLVGACAEFGPRELARLADRILAIVAPEIAEEADLAKLEREEKNAIRKTKLTTQGLGEGMTRIRADLPTSVVDRLTTYLEALAQPRKTHPLDFEGMRFWDLPYAQQLGHAFIQLLEAFDPDRLPVHGGDATTLVVTIGLDELMTGLGTATLATGTRITAGEARRLACTAGIIPAVLDGKSEPLDLGRAKRLFTPAQRKALVIKQSTCGADGCTVPSTWCEAHHVEPWIEGGAGGTTDLDNGFLLCGHHHRLAHNPDYQYDVTSSGWRFIRRA